ncbi:hypothetical protein M231_00004 [Tremella mesenterica]|uniref:Phosphatidylinositol-specific phospholipase C X domain-containing protein n=1 Tax=Tremella mesenterica TaxID=5217 RepID=A0A4Q1BWD0_TREME|nr:hypothetical protein M231_00004 [Tremella mesenterica]
MSLIPDETPLGAVCMPGTHESCALYGYPISQCQQPVTSISRQLEDGIRFLDVRLRVVGDTLLTYHGPRPQRSSFDQILNSVHTFLDAHPTETLILCIKEEAPPFNARFSSLVYDNLRPYLHLWFLEQRIPSLGEVRGKAILFSRFERKEDSESKAWPDGMGIHPTTWPDSRKEGFEWDCGGTPVKIEDWYRLSSFLEIPEKFQTLKDRLEASGDHQTTTPFTLAYASASSFPLALPTTIAKGFGFPKWGLGVEGVNSRLYRWLLQQLAAGKKVRACVMLDFYRDGWDLAGLLIAMNFIDT